MKTKPVSTTEVSVRNRRRGRSVVLKRVKVFIDTGSSMSIIRSDVAEALRPAGPFEESPAEITTVAGRSEARALHGASLCVKSVCFHGDVIVSKESPRPILLGGDFLAAGKCRVDFNRRRLECGGESIPFSLED